MSPWEVYNLKEDRTKLHTTTGEFAYMPAAGFGLELDEQLLEEVCKAHIVYNKKDFFSQYFKINRVKA